MINKVATGNLPLNGILVLEFSQFLAAPSAGLRLADLGARVIKIERPQGGDLCRKLSFKNIFKGNDSLLFHTINRNKESFTADLKKSEDLALVKKLIAQADVLTHNFRPGVMEKIGLDYQTVRVINPKIIYAEVTGYGKSGPWRDKPGQDLLLQSLSGLTWLTGNQKDPIPFGMSIADIFCGAHLVQGILACLYKRSITQQGAYIEVSLLESIIDFQFEFLTTFFNGGGKPRKSNVNHAHALLNAPYGVYKTLDGYLALAMGNLEKYCNVLGITDVQSFINEGNTFTHRDEIKQKIADHLKQNTSSHWQQQLSAQNLWCMPILNWRELRANSSYKSLDIEQNLILQSGEIIHGMSGAITIDNNHFKSSKPAPQLGAHTQQIMNDFNLKD